MCLFLSYFRTRTIVIRVINELSLILFVNLADAAGMGRGGPFLVVCLGPRSFKIQLSSDTDDLGSTMV